jgi:signal transduction histidine kinase
MPTEKDITGQKKAEDALQKSEEQLRQLTIYMDAKNEDERKRLAIEIHDGLGQLLTGLQMDLQWIKKKWPQGNTQIITKFVQMNSIINMAVKEIQKLSFQLRPKMLDDLGLKETLRSEIQQFEERTGIKCILTYEPEELKIEGDKSSMIYRVLMELLTNIYRHAKADEVKIKLKIKNKLCIFTVSDNGIGITSEQINSNSSFGLITINESVKLCNGEVKFFGKFNKGTTVKVSIPN